MLAQWGHCCGANPLHFTSPPPPLPSPPLPPTPSTADLVGPQNIAGKEGEKRERERQEMKSMLSLITGRYFISMGATDVAINLIYEGSDNESTARRQGNSFSCCG